MLKGIDPIISPEMIKILMEMGHGDELVIADGNFPAASVARRLVRADGHDCERLLDAVLSLFPLDLTTPTAVGLMAVQAGDASPNIWNAYRRILGKYEPSFAKFEMIERFAFYERARQAYAVIASGETALYANLILKKGVIHP